jgi:hypothetical protein
VPKTITPSTSCAVTQSVIGSRAIIGYTMREQANRLTNRVDTRTSAEQRPQATPLAITPHWTNLQNLDVAAVEASLGDEAALATRPHGQVDFGLVGTGLHRKPRERRVCGGPAACVFNHAPKVLAVLFGQVRYHDGVIDVASRLHPAEAQRRKTKQRTGAVTSLVRFTGLHSCNRPREPRGGPS